MTPEERLASLETHVSYLRQNSDEQRDRLAEVQRDIRKLMTRVEHHAGVQGGVWKERALNISGAALLVTVASWVVRQLW